MKINESKWVYTIESETAKKFRDAIDNQDLQGVKDSIIDIYEEIFNKGYIDETNFEEYSIEVSDTELDKDAIDYELSQLFDLCDNLSIFIPTDIFECIDKQNIEESAERRDPNYLRAIAFLDENPDAYAYICSIYLTDGSEIPVGRGFADSDDYQDFVKEIYNVFEGQYGFKVKAVNTIYQNNKEAHRQNLHDSLNEENLSGNMSVEDIAKKHNVSVDKIKEQVKKGIEVEKEHTDDEKKAERIALDHLFEMPDYYTRLKKMEKNALKEGKNDLLNVFIYKTKDGNYDWQSNHISHSSSEFETKEKAIDNAKYNLKVKGYKPEDFEFIDETTKSVTEDTIKQGNYWVNKGKEGTHGKFRTRKGADAQRRAMFAQGFKEDMNEEIKEKGSDYISIVDLEDGIDELMDKISEKASKDSKIAKVFRDTLQKCYDELNNINLEECLHKEAVNDEDIDFEMVDDNFDLDMDKLDEALRNFTPASPVAAPSASPEQFVQNNTTIISEERGIISGRQDIQESANTISNIADPNMSYDDVVDIDLI